jgi:hypothetical protein
MAGWRRSVRFFRVVRPVPRLTRLAFGGITLLSAIALSVSATTATRALLPVLVLQAFTVSTGFMGDARRGHFDVLFTGGVARAEVAIVYWLFAMLPGALCWIALGLIDICVSGRTDLFSAGSCAAMGCVSTLPWAATVGLSRFTGAIGWLLTLIVVSGFIRVDGGWPHLWVHASGEPAWFTVAAFLVFPPRLLGERLGSNAWTMLTACALATLAMCMAVLWIARTDIALETGQ